MAFCRSCGAGLKPGAQFCSGCGAAAKDAAVQPNDGVTSGMYRLRGPALLSIGTLGLLVLAVGGWLYTRSPADYGPSADLNDDGFITLAEAEQELVEFPKGKSGRWDVNVEMLENEMGEDYKELIFENIKDIFSYSGCSKNFSHLYQFDADGTLYQHIRRSDKIIDQMAAQGSNVKLTVTSVEGDNEEKRARYSVAGEFDEESADFIFSYGGRENPRAGRSFEPYYRLRVVAKWAGDCDAGIGT